MKTCLVEAHEDHSLLSSEGFNLRSIAEKMGLDPVEVDGGVKLDPEPADRLLSRLRLLGWSIEYLGGN